MSRIKAEQVCGRRMFGGPAGLFALVVAVYAGSAGATSTVPVLDFCSMSTEGDGKRYSKQRLVLFQIGGTAKVEAGEDVVNDKGEKAGTRHVLKQIGGAKQFAETWATTFPLRRFFNLMTPGSAPENFVTRAELSLAEVHKALAGPNEAYLRYSAACTDYLAVPYLKEFSAKWSTGQRKKRVGKNEVTVTTHHLSVKPTVTLAIFRREGSTFKLVEGVEESGGGLFDFVTDLGAGTLSVAAQGNATSGDDIKARVNAYKSRLGGLTQSANSMRLEVGKLRGIVDTAAGGSAAVAEARAQLEELVPMLQDLEDQIDALSKLVDDPQGAADQLARAGNPSWDQLVTGFPPGEDCFGEGRQFTCQQGTFWLPERSVGVAGVSERSSPVCKNANDEVMETVAPCEVRVRAENIALLIRKASQGVEGWRLFAPLQYALDEEDAAPEPAISLGDEEGVRRGSTFFAVKYENGERKKLGFGRVVRSGPGGELGKVDPSIMAMRGGDAPHGSRMEEHPQIGVSFTAGGSAFTGLDTSSEALVDGLGTMVGASLDVGYDLSPYVNWGRFELWLRTNLDLAFGSVSDVEDVDRIDTVNWTMINFLAGPEVKYYLFPRVDVFTSLTAGISAVSASTPNNKVTRDGESVDDSGSGMSGSLRFGAGFDILLHPDWHLRIGANYRQNLQEITLEKPDDVSGTSVFDGKKVGSFSGVDLKGGLTYVF